MLFDDKMVQLGGLRVVSVVQSRYSCPSCNCRRWHCYRLRDGELLPSANYPLVDAEREDPLWWAGDTRLRPEVTEIDECVNCGATISI
jgi:hypothetical protein